MRQRLGALLAIGVAGVVAAAPAVAATTPGTPYRDPASHGSIGLCDRAGHQLTHGSVTAKPFAWRAVSSVAAAAGYGEAGGTATLLAYQPRKGLPSGEWSGDALTSASRYTNPAHPTAAATSADESLQGFITEFRPEWDGLLQLRLYLGAPQEPTFSLTYPSLDIEVTGNTWHVVDGTPVSCHSGKAVSLESIVLKPHGNKTSSTGAATTPKGTDSAAPVPTDTESGQATSADASASSGSGGHGPAIAVAVVAGVVVLGGGGWAARRRLATSATPSEPSKKGR
jgi:hypothetical protein